MDNSSEKSSYVGQEVFIGDVSSWSVDSRVSSAQMPRSKAFLLHRQKGKCSLCGLYFREGDRLELDHILPKSNGGTNRRDNLQLLYKHCHHSKTRNDIQKLVTNTGTYDKSCVTEEPDKLKSLRPVLKTSRAGNNPS